MQSERPPIDLQPTETADLTRAAHLLCVGFPAYAEISTRTLKARSETRDLVSYKRLLEGDLSRLEKLAFKRRAMGKLFTLVVLAAGISLSGCGEPEIVEKAKAD